MEATLPTEQLDAFQRDTLAFISRAHGRCVIADPMGARKTGTTLAWLAAQDIHRTLIVAPSSVHGHWEREAARFYPDAVAYHGTTAGERNNALICSQSDKHPTLYITTYESMKGDQQKLLDAHFDTVVFDEGHKLKGRRTQVALAANQFAKRSRCCIIVTGTPVVNHAAELWQYLHMLLPQRYPAFWKWAETHFKIELRNFRGNRFPVRIIHGFRPGHEDIVRNQIEGIFIQRPIEELFPGQAWTLEPEHVEIAVELSSAERKAYDKLVKFKWSLIEGHEITTRNSLDLTTRLTQLVSEWGTLGADEDGTKVKATTELVTNLVEEHEEPVVIFCKYKETVRRLWLALADKHVTAGWFTGDASPEERDEIVARFQDKSIDVLIGTLDSLSEGVDGLQHRCSTAVFVDRHWTPAKNDQAIGRLRRSGQLRIVTVYHVFAEGTIDATITAACLRKANVVEMLAGRPLKDAIYGRV